MAKNTPTESFMYCHNFLLLKASAGILSQWHLILGCRTDISQFEVTHSNATKRKREEKEKNVDSECFAKKRE